MKKKEYIMIGTKTITKELFRTVLRPLDNQTFRPTGGFWASDYESYLISPWFQYLVTNPILITDSKHPHYTDIHCASLITLKETAKILTIDTEEVLNNVIKEYTSYHHILNYYYGERGSINFEYLSKDYDGIYVDLDKLNTYCFPPPRIFSGWKVNTLLLFNLDAIESYKGISINFYSPNTFEYPYFKEVKENLIIEEESVYHKEIVHFIQELFNKLVKQKSSFNDYDEYFRYLTECTKKSIEIGMMDKKKEANKIRELLKEKNIETTNYIIIRNICADVLSNYLRDNVSIEENLPKTRVRKCREYPVE